MKKLILLSSFKIIQYWWCFIVSFTIASCINSISSQNTYNLPLNKDATNLISGKTQDQSRVFFQSNTSINSTKSDFLSTLEGSQKLSVIFRLMDQKDRSSSKCHFFTKTGFDFSLGVNALYLRPLDITEDSLDLNSLMFPDAANSGVQLYPVWHYWFSADPGSKIAHRLSFECSFSLRQVVVKNLVNTKTNTEAKLNFSVLNYNISPLRYSFYYTTDKDQKFIFTISPYLNYFNIPNEDVTMFNMLFPNNDPLFKPNEKSFMKSFGLKVIGTFNGFSLFADVRQNLNTNNLMDSNPYKGFVFNVGFAQNFITNF